MESIGFSLTDQFRVERIVHLSTVHITMEDDKILGEIDLHKSPFYEVIALDYGHLLRLPDEEQELDGIDRLGLSDAFWHIIRLMTSRGVEWLCFNGEATPSPIFVQHQWSTNDAGIQESTKR